MRMMIVLLLATVSVYSNEPVLLTDRISSYCDGFVLLETGTVVFVDSHGRLCSVDIHAPMEVDKIECEWGLEELGWVSPGWIGRLDGSSDGSLILFTQQVSVPDSLQNPERRVLDPVCLVVASPDGSGGRALALSIEVGGGPQFDFTEDSRFVFGLPILSCLPIPDDYLTYWRNPGGDSLLTGFMIDVETCERSGGNGAFLGDGFYKNPMSDLAAVGGFVPFSVADIITGEILLEDTCDFQNAIIETWVLPDAGLAWRGDTQVLRFADGREIINPGEELVVYETLGDGRSIYSFDYPPSEVLLGTMDWNSFTPEDTSVLAGLEDYLHPYGIVAQTSDGEGIVFESNGYLYYAAIPPLQ